MIREIVKMGHPTLSQRAETVETEKGTDDLINDLFETARANNGIGLAANQIGVLKRVLVAFIGGIGEPWRSGWIAMVNPNITSRSKSTIAIPEGCLSIPGRRRAVKRAEFVTVEYLDYELIPRTATFTGINSIVVQHEMDHLDGVLITDREGLELSPA